MRFHDLNPPSGGDMPDNIVLLRVRREEMPKLEALVMEMDISLHGPIRRIPTGTAFVEVACRDAKTASALRARW